MQTSTGNNSIPKDEDLEKLISDVERDLLFHIIMNMKHRKISIGEAHYLAQDFLKFLPVQDKEDLLKKLLDLGKKYEEAREVYIKYGTPHEEEKRNKLLEAMRDHIKNGDIEKAIETAKGGNQNG